jgi:hypothetical protein
MLRVTPEQESSESAVRKLPNAGQPEVIFAPDPPLAIRHHGEHHDHLGQEHEPCAPVERHPDGVPRLAVVRLLDNDERDREQRGDHHRQVEPAL